MKTRKAIRSRIRFAVFKRDGFRCQYCGRMPPDVELELDHVIPHSKGGSDEPDNLKTSCRECNGGKSNTAAAKQSGDLVGLYLLTIEDGWKIHYVGKVIRSLPGQRYLIEHFDQLLLVGGGIFLLSGNCQVFAYSEMTDWQFFESIEALDASYGPLAMRMQDRLRHEIA